MPSPSKIWKGPRLAIPRRACAYFNMRAMGSGGMELPTVARRFIARLLVCLGGGLLRMKRVGFQSPEKFSGGERPTWGRRPQNSPTWSHAPGSVAASPDPCRIVAGVIHALGSGTAALPDATEGGKVCRCSGVSDRRRGDWQRCTPTCSGAPHSVRKLAMFARRPCFRSPASSRHQGNPQAAAPARFALA